MGIFGNLFKSKKSKKRGMSLGYHTTIASSETTEVDGYHSLNVSIVYACVKVIRETISSLNRNIYVYDGENRNKDINNPNYKVLRQPNEYNTWTEIIELIIASYLIKGNGYIVTLKNTLGHVSSMHWVSFFDMALYEFEGIGIRYHNRCTDTWHSPDEVIHIKELFESDKIGGSRITRNAKTIGKLKASDDLFNELVTEGVILGGVVTYPETMTLESDDIIIQQERRFNAMYGQGSKANKGRIAFLQGGAKLQQLNMAMTLSDAQMAEINKMTKEDILSIFNVPARKVQINTGVSYKSNEDLNTDFLQGAILPIIKKIEEQIDSVFFTTPSQHNRRFKFEIGSLLRADMLNTMKSIKEMISIGLININEGRALIDRNTIENGDIHFYPSNNLTPLQFANKINPITKEIIKDEEE